MLDTLTPGEYAIMVDKGLLIQSECKSRSLKLFSAPVLKKTERMSRYDASKTKRAAAEDILDIERQKSNFNVGGGVCNVHKKMV